MACKRITAAITAQVRGRAADQGGARSVQSRSARRRTSGSTRRARTRWQTAPTTCHVNWVVLDSDWEAEFCRVAESHPRVQRVREEPQPRPRGAVPLRLGERGGTCPTSSCCVDDGHGDDDLLNLVVEIKGYRREDAKEKKSTMDTYWVPGVNNLGTHRPLGVRRADRGLPDRVGLRGARSQAQFDEMLARCLRRRPAAPLREAESHRNPPMSIHVLVDMYRKWLFSIHVRFTCTGKPSNPLASDKLDPSRFETPADPEEARRGEPPACRAQGRRGLDPEPGHPDQHAWACRRPRTARRSRTSSPRTTSCSGIRSFPDEPGERRGEGGRCGIAQALQRRLRGGARTAACSPTITSSRFSAELEQKQRRLPQGARHDAQGRRTATSSTRRRRSGRNRRR